MSTHPWEGYQYPPVPVAWNARDALLFAATIDCDPQSELHFLYESHPLFSAFPTYTTVLTFKHTHTSIIPFRSHFDTYINAPLPGGVPRFDSARVVDGGRTVKFQRQIPTTSENRNFEIRTRCLSVWDKGKGKGTSVELEHTLWEKDGEGNDLQYCRMTEVAYYIGQGGWGGPRGPSISNPPPPSSPPHVSLQHAVPPNAHLLYRLNGDYNPLHANPADGQKAGFGGVIVHGLYGWNVTCKLLLRHFGASEPKNLREFEAKFVSPVYPGDRLRVEAWLGNNADEDGETGWREVRFLVRGWSGDENGEGRVCLGAGIAVIKVIGEFKGGSKL